MARSLWSINSINMCSSFSLLVLYFATFASAVDLAFTAPDLTASGSTLPHYTSGQYVTISWTTPYEETNLLVYQLKETAYAYEVLALNYNTSVTYYVWSAGAVDGQPLDADHPFHFVLENGKSYSCVGCVAQSPHFNVRQAQVQAGTTTSSLSTSSAGAGATSTSQTQTHQTQTHQTQTQLTNQPTSAPSSTPSAVGAAGQDQTTPSQSSSKSHHDLALGLGVGLGVGIPLLLAIAGICFLLARRRRKQKKRISYHPTGSGNWTTDQTQARDQRESGALGPWQTQSRASGLSQMSQQSWHEPFDFEKPKVRDADAMSQLRQSIHSSGSDSRTLKELSGESSSKGSTSRDSWPLSSNPGGESNMKYAMMGGSAGAAKASNGWGAGTAAARKSDVSWANTDISSLEGIPEQLQPVHYRHGSPAVPTTYTNPSRGDGRDWPLP